MRNKVLIPIFLVAIAAVASWNISQNKSDATLSDVALANVEALAEGEGSMIECYLHGCYASIFSDCYAYQWGSLLLTCPDARG